MSTVQEVVNKFNMIGINTVGVNNWAVVYEKHGFYGYVNTSVKNGMVEPCYSEISLFDWFLVATSVQRNMVKRGTYPKEEIKIIILSYGSSKNLLPLNKHIRVQNRLDEQKEYKILHVQNLSSSNSNNIAANILINYKGKVLRLKEYSLNSYLRLVGKTSTGLEVYDLIDTAYPVYMAYPNYSTEEDTKYTKLRLTENFDVLNHNIPLINGIYKV